MDRTAENLSPEQQELLDSGLRMLAQMIAAAHIRRTALRKTGGCMAPKPEMVEHREHKRKTLTKYDDATQPENHHE